MTVLTDDTDTIRTLEDSRYQAVVQRDWNAFALLCHPGLTYSHSSGVTDNLEEYLAKGRAGYYVYHRIEHPIEFIRFVDDIALVIGEMNAEITANGRDKTLRNKCLAVWKRTHEGWRLLAYQPTPLAA